jgi:hypothetical protein
VVVLDVEGGEASHQVVGGGIMRGGGRGLLVWDGVQGGSGEGRGGGHVGRPGIYISRSIEMGDGRW